MQVCKCTHDVSLYLQICEDARTYVRELEAVADLLCSNDVDAVEIHTGAGYEHFRTWQLTAKRPYPSIFCAHLAGKRGGAL